MSFTDLRPISLKRPSVQRRMKPAFTKACVAAVKVLSEENGGKSWIFRCFLVGNTDSRCFEPALHHEAGFRKRRNEIIFLSITAWEWDLGLIRNGMIGPKLGTADVSRVDLVIRWESRRRLSGFLPVQSVYSDFYVVDDYWPDFPPRHVAGSDFLVLRQGVTLGG